MNYTRKKEFSFKGLDAKTELRLALYLIIPALVTMIGTPFIFHQFLRGFSGRTSILIAAFLTFSVCVILLKILVKTIKDKQWKVKIENQILELKFQNLHYQFPLSSIKVIRNVGNHGFRYLTIKTATEKVKIRVGNTALTPFSMQEDVEEVDRFIEFLMPYIKKNFKKKDMNNILDPDVFPNYGEYYEKSEKIKYSFINKMEPWQIIIGGFCLGLLFVCLIIWIVFHFVN